MEGKERRLRTSDSRKVRAAGGNLLALLEVAVQCGLDLDDALEEVVEDLGAAGLERRLDAAQRLLGCLGHLVCGRRAVSRVLRGARVER